MREENLELLITMDDPVEDQHQEDTFHHHQIKSTLENWLGQRFPAGCRLEKRPAAASGSDTYKVTFGEGDWTCTLSKLTGTTNVSVKATDESLIEPLPDKAFDIDVCTITRRQNGEIVERKVFYDLAGMHNQFGVT